MHLISLLLVGVPPYLQKKVPDSISMDDSLSTELTARLTSASSATESRDEDSVSSAEYGNGDDASDDASVDYSYDDFLEVARGGLSQDLRQKKLVAMVETPTSSPPASPEKKRASVRSLKGKLSSSFRVRSGKGDDVSVASTRSIRSLSLRKMPNIKKSLSRKWDKAVSQSNILHPVRK